MSDDAEPEMSPHRPKPPLLDAPLPGSTYLGGQCWSNEHGTFRLSFWRAPDGSTYATERRP